MIEALTGFAGKLAGFLIGPVWKSFTDRFRRPKINLAKAPKNILEHLGPAASRERVETLLGAPHQIVEGDWFYRFRDALVQVEFWDNGGAKSVALGLVGKARHNQFPIPGVSIPLGRLSIADVTEHGSTLRYRDTLRTAEILVELRVGPPGAWTNWTYGALMAVGSRWLQESFFEWDRDQSRLRTDPSLVIVNWVAVSNSSEEVWFDWSIV